ncbi:hypothetical protein TNCV_3295061 [Trichonephila clavipes]|uniref:Uncharacterized protein n=1 Tax=Trichonephila clavipes TaxID=2585209 RepID=A0A8X6VK85_TRICX|nr:hypothetical protein TNCV_3295061 [Trichonephila clavipes]
MAEEKLLDHIISHLESQLSYYVEENWWDTTVNNRYYATSRPQRESNTLGGQGVGDNRRYFSYRPRQKTKDRVVTVQGATCCHLGRVELQIRIREFRKTWEFHILDNMQYQCILGIDFMKDSRLTLDFDMKPLVIPDDQIKPLPIVEKAVEIDLSNTKLGERQKQKLQDLFKFSGSIFRQAWVNSCIIS